MRDYAGDFEVHLTVHTENDESLTSFADWCARRQVKCVRIVLARGEHVEQPMATWRRDDTILPTVVGEANGMARDVATGGLEVARVKVEASPLNKDVPCRDEEAATHPQRNYFEHHVKLRRTDGQSDTALTRACLRHGADLSRNAFRQTDSGVQERFVTLRSHGVGREASEAKLQVLLKSLESLDECILETESEYCVYDSNLDLDKGWLSE